MRMRSLAAAALAAVGLVVVQSPFVEAQAKDLETIRVGWCTRTINSGAVPWAVAQKMGYFAEEGLELKLVPVASGNDCVTFVANGELPYALPALEPVASIVAKGFDGKTFFTLYHGTTWRIAVPAETAAQSIADLKGKRVGVASMSSVMVAVTKGLFINAGLDPEKDVSFIAVGAPANAALAARRGEIDAIAMWDIADMQIERVGTKLRELDIPEFSAPSLGIFSSTKYFDAHKEEATKIARAYAKGSTFTLANPEAALKILYEVYNETRTPGMDEAALLKNDLDFITMRRKIWEPIAAQDGKWGTAVMDAYSGYLKNLAAWGLIDRPVKPEEFITNELIDEVNSFDKEAVTAAAKAYKAN